jgi:hypothetical protein
MNNIRMVKDEANNIYLSQEDLLDIMATRMERFADEIEDLKGPQKSSMVGIDGKPKVTPSNPVAVARSEGMQTMLEGIMGMINITDEDEG